MVLPINCSLLSAKYPQGSGFYQNIQHGSHFFRFAIYMYRIGASPLNTYLPARDDFHIFRLVVRFIEEVKDHHWGGVEWKLMDNTNIKYSIGYAGLRRHISVIAILGRVGHTDHKGFPLDFLSVDVQEIPLWFIGADFTEHRLHVTNRPPDIVVGKPIADGRIKTDACHIEKWKHVYRPTIDGHVIDPVQSTYRGSFV